MAKRILIVDDSKVLRQLVRTYLENRLDYIACAEAADGVEAVEQAQEVAPDLVIVDFCMPRLNGIEAAAILHRIFPKVPIILYTLHKEIIGKAHTQAAGIRSVVSKIDPVDVL